MPDVVHVQVPPVERSVFRLELQQCRSTEVRAGQLAWMQREQQAEVSKVRLQHRLPAQVVVIVPGNDRQPGVEQVVALIVEGGVVPSEQLQARGNGLLDAPCVTVVERRS